MKPLLNLFEDLEAVWKWRLNALSDFFPIRRSLTASSHSAVSTKDAAADKDTAGASEC